MRIFKRSDWQPAGKGRGRHFLSCKLGVALSVALFAMGTLVVPTAQAAVPTPAQDPFYTYQGSTPLANFAPGTVLKTRTLSYHVAGLPLPVTAVQLLYRSTGMLGQPTVNVTSVLEPLWRFGAPKVISYQSFYDSLSSSDEPSYAISGGLTLGGLIPNVESVLIIPALAFGYTVVVPDTEGENADFAVGPEYGMNTLDSLRAALNSPTTGLRGTRQIAMLGYSGGAIATEWAAEMAPSYAPDINRLLVGSAMGGVMVDPDHNLHYVNGSLIWAGIMPMALGGAARAFNVDMTPYLSAYGMQLYNTLKSATFLQVLGEYPGLTFAQLTKPQYSTPESIPVFEQLVNKLIMGTYGTPTQPLLIDQGAFGELEGTATSSTYGEGDGVMVTGDVRSLAREYCARGVTVQYNQYPLDHISVALIWMVDAASWIMNRFAGQPAPQDCSQIAPGNSLAPVSG